jgi:hypothetical protein
MDPIQREHRPRLLGIGATLALLAIAALAAPAGPRSAAAQTPTAASPTPATVSVSGRGTVSVPPDTASVTVGVDVLRPTLDAAQTEATEQATAIIDAASAAGVADDDIQTANYSVTVVRDYDQNGNPADIQGYQVSNQVNLTIRSPEEVGAILDAVVAAGANNIYGIAFYVEDPTAAASQARAAAVRDARAKADELATAAGGTLGRVLSITEGFGAPPPPEIFARGGADMEAAQASVPIETGTSEVAVDVQITFELE